MVTGPKATPGSPGSGYTPSRTALEHQLVSLAGSIQTLFRYVRENGGSLSRQRAFTALCDELVEHFNALEAYHGQYCDHTQAELQHLRNKLFVKDAMIDSLNEWTNEFAKAKGVELELITFMVRKLKNRSPHAPS